MASATAAPSIAIHEIRLRPQAVVRAVTALHLWPVESHRTVFSR